MRSTLSENDIAPWSFNTQTAIHGASAEKGAFMPGNYDRQANNPAPLNDVCNIMSYNRAI